MAKEAPRVGPSVLAGTSCGIAYGFIRLAQALHVSLDDLVFAEGERGPSDDLRLRFEAISHMPEAEKSVIKALLDGMILKYQASKIMGADNSSRPPSA